MAAAKMQLTALRLPADLDLISLLEKHTGEHKESGGTGTRLGRIVVILAGVSALAATILTCLLVSITECVP